jgi:RimJ/RimL family protein N-acetyltransferase
MKIEKENLRIRVAKPEDAKTLCTWWNNGEVMAHAGYPIGLGITEKEVVALIKADNYLKRRLVIELENQPIGEMSYRTPEEDVAEIGIKICEPRCQNKGYGTEYIKMLMEHIFMRMEYEKIILDTNLKNERAQHVYEKLGFRKVSVNIDAWKDQLGDLQSSVGYEMSKDEYIKLYG